MFLSCTELPEENNGNNGNEENNPGVGSSELVLLASDMIIQANGEDAVQLTVLSDGEPVTEGVRLYDGKTNKLLELPDMTFTTTETGEYSFWAAYGTSHTDIVSVTAIGFPVPELPEDPDPENTSFSRKILPRHDYPPAQSHGRRGLLLQDGTGRMPYVQQRRPRIS